MQNLDNSEFRWKENVCYEKDLWSDHYVGHVVKIDGRWIPLVPEGGDIMRVIGSFTDRADALKKVENYQKCPFCHGASEQPLNRCL